MDVITYGAFMALSHVLIQIVFIIRVLIRPHRQPASRVAWVIVIISLPVLGMLIYIFFGEVNIGRKRIVQLREILEKMPDFSTLVRSDDEYIKNNIPQNYRHLFRVGQSINGFEPIGGNTAQLMKDSNSAIDAMVADIDAAEYTVHILFYIWLPDNNGCKIVEALTRAASRGVECRAMADDLGSRLMIRSSHWQSMQSAGVKLAVALPIGNPLLKPLTGRIDLRNHRKIVVIDRNITYCGSQNCADPEFLVKAKYAPWVDIMVRFMGPIAIQNQFLFASDWLMYSGENIDELVYKPVTAQQSGLPAQVIGTGPTVRYSAMPEMFVSLMFTAQRELIISTPYYVPDEAIQNALCSAAYRGINTIIIFPARNDSWVVGAASRSYYDDLLEAGVKIYEYEGGLLHTKSLTMDKEVTLIGSANMDRRSFDLNYENNILLYDRELTERIRKRQMEYIQQSRPIDPHEVASWPVYRKLKNNSVAMFGPIF